MIEHSKKTDERISEAHIPDPEKLPDVGGPYLIVRPVEIRNEIKTKSGVKFIMPESVTDDVKYLCNVARVLQVGPYAFKSPELDQGPWFAGGDIKVGDFIVYGRFAGQNIRYMGVNLKMIKDTDIRLRVTDPTSLDTFVNLERS